MLAMQARQKLAAAQDLHAIESMQALQKLVCTPSREQEVDWHLPVEGDTELHTAIRRGDSDGDDSLHVLLLHGQGAGIEVRNKRGDTPLLLASQTDRSGHYTPTLFSYPLDVNAKNVAGFTALYYAMEKNDDGCMEKLLKNGANPNFVDEGGNTLLHIAAQSDAFYAAGQLARSKRYTLSPNQLNKSGLAPLHIAILKNFKHTACSILWEANANPNTLMAGENPLIFAIRNELIEIIRDLVKKGADASAKDAMGNSALDLALTRRDNISIMGILLDHGEKPDVKDADGNTPLVRAVKDNDAAAVRTLSYHAADPNIPDAHGVMPIFHAVKNNDINLVGALLSHGASLEAKDANGNTPLACALQNDDTDMAFTLICHGANPNIPGADGVMPIFHALRLDDLSSAAHLVENGARLDIRDAEGNTPLHLAVQFANLVSLMIAHEARVDAVNKAGDTPLHCVESMAPITSYLLRLFGADINLKNKEGRTPYEKAEHYCRDVRMLDGRLLDILEPPRPYGLIGWFSGEQPKASHLASAESYGITLANLPGIQLEDTRSFDIVVPGQDSRIERLDDDEQAAAATRVPEESERAQELQPRGSVRTGWQVGTEFVKQAAACFCPRKRAVEQSHDSAQAVSNPRPESALPISANPQGRTAPLLCFDDPDVTQSSTKHRFFVPGQP
jgi:ankyrin repeat protein